MSFLATAKGMFVCVVASMYLVGFLAGLLRGGSDEKGGSRQGRG